MLLATFLRRLRRKLALLTTVARTVALPFFVLSLLYTPHNWAAEGKSRQWYRAYADNGVPMLSSTVSEDFMRRGYEVLDQNMVVTKKVAPFTPEAYAKHKMARDLAEAKRQVDRNLMKVHVSASSATAQRDRILADMSAREVFLQSQLNDLKKELAKQVASAASYERRQQKIPFGLQTELDTSRTLVSKAENNLVALKQRQNEIRTQYGTIIQRLTYLEQHRELLASPMDTRQQQNGNP